MILSFIQIEEFADSHTMTSVKIILQVSSKLTSSDWKMVLNISFKSFSCCTWWVLASVDYYFFFTCNLSFTTNTLHAIYWRSRGTLATSGSTMTMSTCKTLLVILCFLLCFQAPLNMWEWKLYQSTWILCICSGMLKAWFISLISSWRDTLMGGV